MLSAMSIRPLFPDTPSRHHLPARKGGGSLMGMNPLLFVEEAGQIIADPELCLFGMDKLLLHFFECFMMVKSTSLLHLSV